jgi:hypothetical protein
MDSNRDLTVRAIASAILAVVLTFSISHPVLADHGYLQIGSTGCGGSPVNCVSVGYDNYHLIYLVSVEPGMQTATLNTMAQDYTPTDLNMYQTTVWSHADVYVYDYNYGQNGAAGWVECPPGAAQGINAFGDRWCKGQTLKYNYWAGYAPFWNDAPSRDYLACHEMGHTVGLQHWWDAGTCMYPDWPDGPTVLHQYDKNEINWYYAPYP